MPYIHIIALYEIFVILDHIVFHYKYISKTTEYQKKKILLIYMKKEEKG